MRIKIHDTNEAEKVMRDASFPLKQIQAIQGREFDVEISKGGWAEIPCFIDEGCTMTWLVPPSAFTVIEQ